MEDLKQQLKTLAGEVAGVAARLKIDEKATKLSTLEAQIATPDFWNDQSMAQTVSQERAKLETAVKPWRDLHRELSDMEELAAMDDTSIQVDLTKQLASAQARFDELKIDLRYNGPYDEHDVIMSLYAGAGGTDAQDWAQMLLRMYIRWAEMNGYKYKTIEQSEGEEAGIKSVTLQIDGEHAYGKLKGEQGVHRLVRLSPFNADNLRQTSFAKVDIMPKIDSPADVEIDDKDLKIDVYRSGGHGGQSVNTTDSAVRVTHQPTGIVVAIQNERSQLQNRETAMTILRSKLALLKLEQHKDKISELKGPNEQAAWGNQIRSYVLHPYKMVKDLRTHYETSDTEAVLNGGLEPFIEAYLAHSMGK